MINVVVLGVPRVKAMLSKLEGINRLVTEWMKSGNPDEIMQKSFSMNFARSGRPKKWQELSEETEYRRELEGYPVGPPLIKSGKLMDEITSMRGRVSSTLGYSQMTWGIEQLTSENKKKFGANQIGKGRSGQYLPSRPMIGFQKQDGKVLVKDLRDWILKSIK